MTLIVDVGALFVQANRVDQDHGAITNCLAVEPTPIVTSELALAEADYLILTRLGIEAELIFLDDLAAGIL